MANEFIARNGLIALQSSQISGSLTVTSAISASSLTVTGNITGSGTSVFATTGSNRFNGNQIVTGSFTVTTGSVVELQVTNTGVNIGNITTDNHNVTGSLKVSGSLTVTTTGTELQVTNTGVNLGNISTDVHNVTGSLRVSGSNSFNGNQAITGSLTVTGQVVAQTLNVQQVTSSIVFSSGSNIFGNSLSNTQQFTGSVSVTGSLTVNGAGTFASSVTADSLIIANNDARIRNNDATGRIILSNSSTNTFAIFYGTSHPTNANQTVFANGGVTTCTFSSVGAATFASSVTAASYISNATSGILFDNTSGGTNATQIRLQNTGGNMRVGIESSTGGTIQVGTSAYAAVFGNQANAATQFTTNGTLRMTITSDGNVGIGNSSPVQKLHVEGSTAIGTTGTEDILLLGRALSGGVSFQQAASLKLGRYQNAGGSFESYTRLDFALRDDSASSNYNTNTTVMTLTNAGNVGIGTTSPTSKLHVISALGTVGISLGESGNNQRLQLGQESSYTGNYINSTNIDLKLITYRDGGTGGTMLFYTSVDTNPVERMRITSGGNTEIRSGNILNIYRTDNTRALQLSTTSNECLIDAWAATSEPLMLRSNGTGGRIVFHTNGEERMRITSDNNVLFNTTSTSTSNTSSFIFRSGTGAYSGVMIMNHATTNNTGAGFIDCYYNTSYIGGIGQNGASNVSFLTSSDYRLKEDLKDFDGLSLISSLKVYDFKWKTEDSRMYGLLAHELQEVIPYTVSGNKDEIKENGKIKVQVVDYSKLIPVLVKSIQELKSENDTLKSILQRNNIS
jgi:hypothetical protein